MEFRVSIEYLKEKGLTLTQYLLMYGLYHGVKIYHLVLDQEGINKLLKDEWIRNTPDGYALTPRGIEVFEPNRGLFDDFIDIFPKRVNDMKGTVRVLSPASADSLSGKKLKHKWFTVSKNKTELQEHIIECLKKEVDLRKREGSLIYMRNAETWLNKATWEDYEYLLEENIENKTSSNFGEIKL
jgi:hypothetical protein